MNSENSILGNQLVVMSRADLDALVEKMASNLIAMRVEAEDKTSRGNDVCPVVYNDERFITSEETAKPPHCGDGTSWGFFVLTRSGQGTSCSSTAMCHEC